MGEHGINSMGVFGAQMKVFDRARVQPNEIFSTEHEKNFMIVEKYRFINFEWLKMAEALISPAALTPSKFSVLCFCQFLSPFYKLCTRLIMSRRSKNQK